MLFLFCRGPESILHSHGWASGLWDVTLAAGEFALHNGGKRQLVEQETVFCMLPIWLGDNIQKIEGTCVAQDC